MKNTSATILILLIACLCNYHQAAVAFQPASTSKRGVKQITTHSHFAHQLNYQNDSQDDNIIETKMEAEEADPSNVRGDITPSTPKEDLQGSLLDVFFPKDRLQKLPPVRFEDMNLLFYDVFLIINLSLSISFWVTHRMNFAYLPSALNEGCIFSVFWIMSGLYHGAFLMSAVDGHYGSTDERSGPKAAAALGLNTYVNAINLRLVFALVSAVLHHRQVGGDPIEELIPLEIGCGIFLMTMWRALHSYVTPRI